MTRLLAMTALEDELEDIVGKAGGSPCGLDPVDLITEGTRLGLHPEALQLVAENRYPLPGIDDEPIRRCELPFGPHTVNAWLVGPSGDCVLVDTGFEPDAAALLDQSGDITPRAVLLTHDDRDHWGAGNSLRQRWPDIPFLGPAGESPAVFQSVPPGKVDDLKGWNLATIELPGHTPHGVTWQLEHPSLCRPVLACGDALLAGSIGKIRGNYEAGLRTIHERLLILPDNWILLPGHGPATTVGNERVHNPFFAGSGGRR